MEELSCGQSRDLGIGDPSPSPTSTPLREPFSRWSLAEKAITPGCVERRTKMGSQWFSLGSG